jgi:hypothetical protein
MLKEKSRSNLLHLMQISFLHGLTSVVLKDIVFLALLVWVLGLCKSLLNFLIISKHIIKGVI